MRLFKTIPVIVRLHLNFRPGRPQIPAYIHDSSVAARLMCRHGRLYHFKWLVDNRFGKPVALLVDRRHIKEGIHRRCAEFNLPHVIVRVDYQIIRVVHTGLPVSDLARRQREFQYAVAKRTAGHDILCRGIGIRP